MENPTPSRPHTYVNPVYGHSFPDPFVLKYRNEYFAYCTDFGADGGVFQILRSDDLVNWSPAGSAMAPLDTAPPFYWAPEVTEQNGKFYLYYSVGNETLMEIRVAVSDRPDGGFVDAGKRLTSEEFAIDPHVFIDADGERYLFYATDFLDHSHIGTGTVVDKMTDWFALAGDPRPVTRARYDWQVYDPKRENKGGVRWHTVEGPFVLARKGRFYEMFSGGNWQNTTYGVSFAVTGSLSHPEEWTQFSDGEKILPILRTVPDRIIGPGHNCVVRGPNNRELFCVYHRWTDDGRVLAIDRLDFAGERMFIIGATDTPQPAPFEPSIRGFGDPWTRRTVSEWACPVPRSFLAEFTWHGTGHASVRLASDASEMQLPLPSPETLVRVEVDGRWAKVTFDGWQTAFEGWLESAATRLVLSSNDIESSFSGFALTEGFEDLCDRGPETVANGEWMVSDGSSLAPGASERVLSSGGGRSMLWRGQLSASLDFAANIGTAETTPANEFGLLLVEADGGEAVRLTVGSRITLDAGGGQTIITPPEAWLTGDVRQYRLLAVDGRLTVYFENMIAADLPFPPRPLSPAIFCSGGSIAIEMVRATII